MKVGQDYFPKSSFLSTDKDLSTIFERIMGNQRLLKMLYYTQADCLKAKDLTQPEIFSMINKQLKIVPKLEIDELCPIRLIVTLDNYRPNKKNPEFRDCTLNFYILCHPDHWNLGNFQLRPHKIVGELDAMFNKQKMSGIGTPQFLTSKNITLNDELMGMMVIYQVIHGIEDSIKPLT